MKELIFVSSVQKELAGERGAIRDFVRGDALLGQFFDVFLFEDLPASDQTPAQLYIGEVDRCAIYLGVFGNEYGWEDAEGISPTEREFDRATVKRKNRLVFVKGSDDSQRQAKMKALIRKAEGQLTRRRFVDTADLTSKIYASLIRYLEQRGVLPHRPFHAAACRGATLQHIDDDRVAWFVQQARAERQIALSAGIGTREALISLNLLDQETPTNAAVLLFGKQPQQFLPSAEVKCLHFHGTRVVKPIPSYQIFKGTLFDQSDKAVDFIMAILGRTVGTRQAGSSAPVDYEIPRAVVAEAVINAIAHRDYTSAAATQVYVFADRIEIWNPGELPASLTPQSLRQQHPSLPRNPLIAEPLFQAHYIEKVGTGTLDVIAGCQASNLPEPEFVQDGDQFVLRIWRDWLTAEIVAALQLNDRQMKALTHLKAVGRITTSVYQKIAGAPRRTALRDLDDLVVKGALLLEGSGRGAHYIANRKRATNAPNAPSASENNRAINAPNAPLSTPIGRQSIPRKAPARSGGKRSRGTRRIGPQTTQLTHKELTSRRSKRATKGPKKPQRRATEDRARIVPIAPPKQSASSKPRKKPKR